MKTATAFCVHRKNMSHALAVLEREIEQDADEFVAAAAGLFRNFVNLIDDLFADADGERLVAIRAAGMLHRVFEFFCHGYHLIVFIISESVKREYDYAIDIE